MAFWHNALLRRTFIFMVAGLAGLAAIVAASLWLTERVDNTSDDVIQERQVRTLAAALLAFARDAETGQRGYLLTGERGYLAPYERAAPQVAPTLAQLKELAVRTPRIKDDTEAVARFFGQKMGELGRTVALQDAGQHAEALELVRSDVGKAAMDGLRTRLVAMVTDSDSRVSQLLAESQQATTALFWTNSLSSAWIIALALAAAWTVARYMRELSQARIAVVAANLSLEDRVKERTADLARANDEIQRFAYIVSHDLRAPLVNIVGFTSELETSMQDLQRFVAVARVSEEEAPLAAAALTAANADLPEAIGFVRASTGKMDRLINAILKLSREGRRELRPEPIDLHALFSAVAASVQHQLETKETKIEIADTLPTVVSDRLALDQVFGNLIDNAIKYLDPSRPGVISISARVQGSQIVTDIADNGRGIAAADHERIFELFRRSGLQNVRGEGIGLAHVRALVRRLGGDITVESQLGQGSRFRVTMPRVYVRRADQDKA